MAAETRERRKITIEGNWRSAGTVEFAGSGTVDRFGAVECAADLGGDAYDQIEDQIADGQTSGKARVEAEDGRTITYRWEIEVCGALDGNGIERCGLAAGHSGPHCSPWGEF